jgi:hypothetical protein
MAHICNSSLGKAEGQIQEFEASWADPVSKNKQQQNKQTKPNVSSVFFKSKICKRGAW